MRNRTKHSSGARPPQQRQPISFNRAVPALTPPQSFLDECAAFGVSFDAGDLDRLGRYLALLLEANKSFNLTSITDPDEAWRKHVFDSLTLIPLLAELPDGAAIADVGSGGGLPGIPLAICLPTLQFTLIEATGKKAEFLRIVAAELALKNVRIVNDRAETVGHDGARHRAMYDAVVARAVGKIAVIAELCVPLAADPPAPPTHTTPPAPSAIANEADTPPARVLLIKGERAVDELAEAKQALHLLHAAHAGTIDTPTGRIVVLEKSRPTPGKYPRKDGEPKRAPLGA